MKRFGSAVWNGSLREGQGSVSTESCGLENHPYTFFSRYDTTEVPAAGPCRFLLASTLLAFSHPPQRGQPEVVAAMHETLVGPAQMRRA